MVDISSNTGYEDDTGNFRTKIGADVETSGTSLLENIIWRWNPKKNCQVNLTMAMILVWTLKRAMKMILHVL